MIFCEKANAYRAGWVNYLLLLLHI